MLNKLRDKRGMALVVAIMTAFILLALVASLFWVIAATSRQTNFAKNAAIALNLAEAGIADAMYRLNYCTGVVSPGDAYPFNGSLSPFDWSATGVSVLISLPQGILTAGAYPNLLTGTNTGIRGALNNGNYYVGLLNDGSGSDTLISVGVFQGVSRILAVPLRGRGDPNTTRNVAQQGISEAFNKHVIYAATITGTGSVTGNVAYVNNPPPTAGTSRTKIDPALFGVCKPDTGIVFPPAPAVNGYSYYLRNGYGYSWTTLNDPSTSDTAFACDPQPLSGGLCWRINGITYSGGDYSVGDTRLRDSSYYVYDNGHIGIDNSNAVIFKPIGTSGGNIAINVDTTIDGANTVFSVGGAGTFYLNPNLTITGQNNNGALRIRGVTLSIPGGTTFHDCAVMCDKSIALTTGSGPITIDDGSSSDTAAILSLGDNASITVGLTINVNNMGANQHFLLMAYNPGDSGPASITLGRAINTSASGLSNWHGTVAAAYSENGTASVTINNSLVAVGSSTKGELILAYGAPAGNIAFSAGTIYGTLVANGTVSLTGGTLSYVTSTFMQAATNLDIYREFFNGKRAYVPAPGQWRLR